VSYTLVGPFEQAHGIAFGFKKSFQIREQRRIFLTFFFAPATLFSLSLPWGIAFSRFHFSDSAPDCVGGDARRTRNKADAPSLFGFQSYILSPLLLIQELTHLVLCFSSINLHHVYENTPSLVWRQVISVRTLSVLFIIVTYFT
jgi:hypothetical protein